jgi:hypothetical protein
MLGHRADLSPAGVLVPLGGEMAELPRGREAGRREVDGDASSRHLESGVPQGGADPLARLEHGAPGQAHDREARQPEGDVDLDAHRDALDADDRGAERRGEHGHSPFGGGEKRSWRECRSPACSPPY